MQHELDITIKQNTRKHKKGNLLQWKQISANSKKN